MFEKRTPIASVQGLQRVIASTTRCLFAGREELMNEKSTGAGVRETDQRLARQSSPSSGSPFRMLERFADEMDRLFDDFGFGRSWMSPRFARYGMPSRSSATTLWWPAIDVFHRNNELIIRADLPGLKKEDLKVDVTDEAITVSGERRGEQEQEHGGVYRSERTYGSFARTIPLPEGTITDQAKAVFKDGVLEITVPAPPEQVNRGRRLEITESAAPRK